MQDLSQPSVEVFKTYQEAGYEYVKKTDTSLPTMRLVGNSYVFNSTLVSRTPLLMRKKDPLIVTIDFHNSKDNDPIFNLAKKGLSKMAITPKELLKCLLELQEVVPLFVEGSVIPCTDQRPTIHPGGSICYWIAMSSPKRSSEDIHLISQIVRTWKHFSGCPVYPVPPSRDFIPKKNSHDNRKECMHAFDNSSSSLWTGEYGQLRIELLEHMISELKNMEDAL